jgi:hypothetical protein
LNVNFGVDSRFGLLNPWSLKLLSWLPRLFEEEELEVEDDYMATRHWFPPSLNRVR